MNLVRQSVRESLTNEKSKFDYMGAIDCDYKKLERIFGMPDTIKVTENVGWLLKNSDNHEVILIQNSNCNQEYKECLKWNIFSMLLSRCTVNILETLTDSFFYDWMI